MRKLRVFCAMLAAVLLFAPLPAAADSPEDHLVYTGNGELSVKLAGRYISGAGLAEGGAEIVAFDERSGRLFSVNGAEKALDIIDLTVLGQGEDGIALPLVKRIRLAELHDGLAPFSDVTSVAVSPAGGLVAVSVAAEPKTDPGFVVFLDTEGRYLHHVQAGPLPDMVAFTPDGKKALTANEGEPNDDYSVDPEGSVTIIDLSGGFGQVRTVHAGFRGVPVSGEVRRQKPDHSLEQNLEPEYIAIARDGRMAYVSLQETNAIGVLDVEAGRFEAVYGLGYKDWSAGNNKLDVTDKDGGAHIRHWPVLSAYMPDGIALLEQGGKTWLITANEGDSAVYGGYSEEVRVADLTGQYALNADLFEGYTQEELDRLVADGLFSDRQLGRLKTTVAAPKNADGKYEAVYAFGGRSFSVLDAEDMRLVFDSGGDFETITADALPDFFNPDNEENSLDSRSDDKGPEPEAVVVGNIGGTPYLFIGLEQTGGIVAYDMSDPVHPTFTGYFTSRDFRSNNLAGDVAPEGLAFVNAKDSPTGKALLIAAHEVSGTIAVYELVPKRTAIRLIHVNDVHSRVFEDANAGMGYAKMAALVEQYRALNPNTLLIDGGDTYHGQTFSTLVRGESIVHIMNEMGFDVQTAGNHDFNYGTGRLLELAEMADFPVLGANVYQGDERVLPAKTVIELDGIRIGIFGLATPETAFKTHPDNVRGIAFHDSIAEAKKQVAELQQMQADVIIAVGHIGMDASSLITSDKIVAAVDGIDVFIDGHSHQVINETINGTLIVQTGEYLKNVGIVTLTFEDGKLTGKSAKLVPREEMADAEPDERIAGLIEEIRAAQESVLGEVVGRTAVFLDGERETVRGKESNLGNLIADAMLYVTGADAALTNGGGIRASIEAGDITKGDIITVLPFGNYIVTLNVTGEQLLAALQHGAGDYPELKGGFPQVAGLQYAIDPARPKGEKVHSVMVGGAPLDPKKTYVLATNDFLAAGGDEYTMLADRDVLGHYPALDEALIAYIQETGTVAPAAEGRIAEKPYEGGTSRNDRIIYTVKPGDTLSHIGRRYGVDWRLIAEINRLKNPHLIYPNQTLVVPVK